MDSTNLDNEIVESNKEIIDDMAIVLSENIKTYSRDWTVETIYNQIRQGNIELNPKFQRRNAWTDEKRSRLIESLILKLPVPSIVLAESHTEKNKFVVKKIHTSRKNSINYIKKIVLKKLNINNIIKNII